MITGNYENLKINDKEVATKEYVFHPITDLCELQNEEITVSVKYAVIKKSGTLYPEYHALEPQCSLISKCLLIKRDNCSVMKAARKVNPI